MKNHNLIKFSILLLFIFVNITFAAEVTIDKTKEIATAVYSINKNIKIDKISSSEIIEEIIPQKIDDKLALRIVNYKSGGFAIISGDDKARPLIGYSFENKYNAETVHPAFEFWLQQYKDQIINIINSEESQAPEVAMEWKNYLKITDRTQSANVTPMITAKWGQSCFYNKFCPYDPAGPCDRAVVGCVAVSMAQIMYYYQYPAKGKGSYSYNHPIYGKLSAQFGEAEYDYSKMADRLDQSNSQYHDEVAELLAHCGVSVDMNYSPSGSGSLSWRVHEAMIDYFDYHESTKYVQISQQNSYKWIDMVRDEILEGRPLYYSAYDEGGYGHAFNIDGLENNNYFHLNWGWNGNYDGYYLLTDLSPNTYNFKYGHAMVYNIIPNQGMVNIVSQQEESYCKGGTLSINFEVTEDDFVSNNEFLLELSDEDGEFNDNNPNIIASETNNNARTIRGLIPTDIKSSKSYRVRVRSTKPAKIGMASKYTLNIVGPDPMHFGDKACPTESSHKLKSGIPSGGYFEGKYVKGESFLAQEAGPGEHEVQYLYEDGNGCIGSVAFTVRVSESIDILTESTSLCEGLELIDLYDFVEPDGGRFSGQGIREGHYFSSEQAGAGLHTLYYIYENEEECQFMETLDIDVKEAYQAILIADRTSLCDGSEIITIKAEPEGGEFIGEHISSSGEFDPSVGPGSYSIAYVIESNEEGECDTYGMIEIDVHPTPETPEFDFKDSYFEVTQIFDSYQWYLDGKPLQDETDKVCIPKASGTYYVEVFEESGTCNSISEEYEFDITSVKTIIGNNNISIYPNPAHDEITIEFEKEFFGILRIIDLNGNKLFEREINNNLQKIDLYEYSSGIYFLEVNQKGNTQRFKFSVSR